MASIRLFGRGRNAAAAGGPAVGAAAIADVLESVAAASMSTTWRCRHSAGVSIGEGAVDFTARRSRSTVIRGKYAFEYVRSGASVYRAPVIDEDSGVVAAGVKAPAAVRAPVDVDVDDDEDAPEAVEGEEFDPELDGDEDESDGEEDDGAEFDESLEPEESEGSGEGGEEDGEDAEFELDAEDEVGEDGGDEIEGSEGDEDAEDGASDELAASAQSGSGVESESESDSAGGSVWERFSDHDACGVHAYAEPAVLAAGVRASGVVQARDAEEFDGVKLAAYAVTLKPKPGDPNRVLARLARQLRDHGANVVVVTAFVDESEAEAESETASGSDGGDAADSGGAVGARIVRLRIELPHWTPADDPTADHSVSVDLFEFGEPVSVQVPEGATRRTARTCADLGLF